MTVGIRHCVWLSLLVCSWTFGAGSARAEVPEIPLGTVETNPFVEKLRNACDALVKADDADIEPPEQAAWTATELRAAVVAARAEATATPPVAPAPNGQALVRWVAALQATCRKLIVTAPSSPALGAPDLVVLRAARENPDALDVAKELAPQLKVLAQAQARTGLAARLQPAFAASGDFASSEAPAAAGIAGLPDLLIRGMAEFLAKRTKQEALRYLREKLERELCSTEAIQFFPNTCAAIRALDESQALQAIGSYLRSAAEEDLRQLPDHTLESMAKDPSLIPFAYSGEIGLAFFRATRSGRQPFEVLRDTGLLPERACEKTMVAGGGCQELARAVRVSSAFVYALQQAMQQGDPSSWSSFFQGLVARDVRLVTVALVLLVEHRFERLAVEHGITSFWSEQSTLAVVNDAALNRVQVWSVALNMHARWATLAAAIAQGEDSAAEQRRIAETLVQSLDSAAMLVEQAWPFVASLATHSGQPVQPDVVRKHLPMLRAAGTIAAAIATRDYGAATIKLLTVVNRPGSKPAVPGKVSALLPLVVELAQAQSANDVAATLDAYAAPVGSYRTKYEPGVQLTLNGMFGAFFGSEQIDEAGVDGNSAVTGAFAPIGLHATVGWGGCCHLGLELAVLDLGAVTAYRFDSQLNGELEMARNGEDPDAKQAPELGFAQVFSPGAFLTLGLFESPAVLGFGASFSPELRKVTDDSVETEVATFRVMAFLAVDISIVTLIEP